MGNFEAYAAKLIDLFVGYAPTLLLAIVTLFVGFWIIKLIVKLLDKALEKGEVDISLRKFLSSLVSILLKVILIISVISMIGIATTSFIAILGAAGLAIGLALQGSLANFAGGVLILIFRPFKVGDFINAQGHAGTVDEIKVFNTVLKTPDNKTIFIPNGPLSNGSIINFSKENQRRVDLFFGVSYADDLNKAKKLLNHVLESQGRVLKEPAPSVLVSQLGDNGVSFEVRAWCKTEDYWDVYYDLQENVKLAFDKGGISVPIPHRIFIQQK